MEPPARHPVQRHARGRSDVLRGFRAARWSATLGRRRAIWVDGALYFTSGPGTLKSRNLATNPACSVSVRLRGIDLALEGEAQRVTDASTLERVAAVYRTGGWPALVERRAHGPVQRAQRGTRALAHVPPHAAHRRRCGHRRAPRRHRLGLRPLIRPSYRCPSASSLRAYGCATPKGRSRVRTDACGAHSRGRVSAQGIRRDSPARRQARRRDPPRRCRRERRRRGSRCVSQRRPRRPPRSWSSCPQRPDRRR